MAKGEAADTHTTRERLVAGDRPCQGWAGRQQREAECEETPDHTGSPATHPWAGSWRPPALGECEGQ